MVNGDASAARYSTERAIFSSGVAIRLSAYRRVMKSRASGMPIISRYTCERWKFAFARYYRTREFDGQRSRPSFGSFTISRAF